MYIYDGEKYEKESDIPDLGSWRIMNVDPSTNKRDYIGLSTDAAKLPVYDDLGNGSSAICVDTSELYMYLADTKTWYEV